MSGSYKGLGGKNLFKACKATLDSRDTEVLFFLLKYIHVLKVMSCTGLMKEKGKKDVVGYL